MIFLSISPYIVSLVLILIFSIVSGLSQVKIKSSSLFCKVTILLFTYTDDSSSFAIFSYISGQVTLYDIVPFSDNSFSVSTLSIYVTFSLSSVLYSCLSVISTETFNACIVFFDNSSKFSASNVTEILLLQLFSTSPSVSNLLLIIVTSFSSSESTLTEIVLVYDEILFITVSIDTFENNIISSFSLVSIAVCVSYLLSPICNVLFVTVKKSCIFPSTSIPSESSSFFIKLVNSTESNPSTISIVALS